MRDLNVKYLNDYKGLNMEQLNSMSELIRYENALDRKERRHFGFSYGHAATTIDPDGRIMPGLDDVLKMTNKAYNGNPETLYIEKKRWQLIGDSLELIMDNCTKTECKVLELLLGGKSKSEIAKILGNHRSAVTMLIKRLSERITKSNIINIEDYYFIFEINVNKCA